MPVGRSDSLRGRLRSVGRRVTTGSMRSGASDRLASRPPGAEGLRRNSPRNSPSRFARARPQPQCAHIPLA
ncbi:hypothetical protein FM104_11150 [Microbacterium esteraromaticum]|uniref:Uncharacterized protein n=1 Tax=Microbacterium esteraromaticum TaxID=57043 RepID=A0A1R4K901_9MICO|nr:hypothetical protein FM104_11150 [Microbacterium esteraromaticum]